MKHFVVTYSNRGTRCRSLGPKSIDAASVPNYDDAQVYRVAGQVVSATEFYAEANAIEQAKLDKKNTTHRRVMVATGVNSLPQNRRPVWVRR